MEKTIKKIIEVEETRHEFYCDRCGEYLGASYECEDGWYKKFGEFELKCYIDGWLHLKRCLCNKCQHELINKVKTTLFNIGFKVEH